MKSNLISLGKAIVFIVSACIIFSFIVEEKKNLATVDQIEGIFIFTDSKPVSEYDYLGSEKLGFTMGSGQYKDVRDKLIKKVKKQYPAATGIIFHFNDGDTDKADAIKLK